MLLHLQHPSRHLISSRLHFQDLELESRVFGDFGTEGWDDIVEFLVDRVEPLLNSCDTPDEKVRTGAWL
jgi:hypothetical protein